MQRRYATADVFTDRRFGGNPVAVVLDGDGLSDVEMQALALEFNYVETTFVLSPRDLAHTAQVRIFTPEREIPFAGHPTIGTAFILANEARRRGETVPDRLVLEEAAGLVPVDLIRDGDAILGGELTAPDPLTRGATVSIAHAAACLSLSTSDVSTAAHPPQIASVGLPFLVVELASREALSRAVPNRQAFGAVLPLDGARSVYAYTRDVGSDPRDIQARMFTNRMVEDPATGSATSAMTALLADVGGGQDLDLRVRQGVDMGRPSLLLAQARRQERGIIAFIGGRCVPVFEGSFTLA